MARSYTQTARADAVAEREMAVLEAAFDAFFADYYDDVTLKQIAETAGTTEQTVLRYFGSKEGLFDAIVDRLGHRLAGDRESVEPGDWRAAVEQAVDTYETYGERNLLMLDQEGRVPAIARACERGRLSHREMTLDVFAPYLPPPGTARHAELAALFVVALDVYTWKLLRLDAGLGRVETERAMGRLVEGLLDRCGELDRSDREETS